ncbi:MAG: ABC transporter ATP-binding protein [Erysipelotrichaceae bacterium]|nr:ABC transporter ATP-binding protein [Erysipelotrichaceae bacterium]
MCAYIQFKDIKKCYEMGEITIEALSEVSFSINKGEFVVIAGASGAGKSTVLNLLGGMDVPTSGSIIVDGKVISDYSQKELTSYRRYDIGFVFQFYNLVANLTVKENVELATQISKSTLSIEEIIEAVGLSHRIHNFPSQLSGGEQQRVAIARAIAKNPKLLLCDEPTGALDYETGKAVLKLLQDICRTRGVSVIVITHNLALTQMGDKVIYMRNGKLERIVSNEHPISVERIEW